MRPASRPASVARGSDRFTIGGMIHTTDTDHAIIISFSGIDELGADDVGVEERRDVMNILRESRARAMYPARLFCRISCAKACASQEPISVAIQASAVPVLYL